MDKENKIKQKEIDIKKIKSQLEKRRALLASNDGKINITNLTIRRLESNLRIHQQNLKELINYKRKEESQKVREEGVVRGLENEISVLKREISRDKITR